MSKTQRIALLLSILCTLAFAHVHAQPTLPPLPSDLHMGTVLFPQAQQLGSITNSDSMRYIMLAEAGDSIHLRMTRRSGSLVPYLELRRTPNSEPLFAQAATDLAGQSAELNINAVEEGWYYVLAGNDPASGEPFTGDFDLLLTGSTPAIYSILEYGYLPSMAEDARVLLHRRTFTAEARQDFYLPIGEGEQLAFADADALRARLYDADDALLADGAAVDGYISERRQWLRLVLRRATDEAQIDIRLDGEPVPLVMGVLGDFVSPTPMPTATATPAATHTPTATATRPPTATPLPTPTTRTPGTVSAATALASGVLAEVYVEDDGLRLRTDTGTNFAEIERMPRGTLVVVLDGPVAAQGYRWWYVLSPSGNQGWSVEGADGMVTLIPRLQLAADSRLATTSDDTRLWSEPDAKIAQIVADIPSGRIVVVTGEPVRGYIRLDSDLQDDWYPVVYWDGSRAQNGWIWQGRLRF